MNTFALKRKNTSPNLPRVKPTSFVPRATPISGQQNQIRRILQITGVQAKLTIGQPNDKFEQEADRVADKVMRMSDADVAQRVEAGTVQPMQIQRMCPECEEEMQAKEQPGQTPQVTSNLESRINSLKGGGQPLDSATRSFFEPRFGHDFSHVRVHQGGQAEDVSRSINARAFTLGNHVVFDSGQYSPDSNDGKRLLGHELTHVVQQVSRKSMVQRDDYVYGPDSFRFEPFGETCEDVEINDSTVQQLIDDALLSNDDDLSGAFRTLRAGREGHCCDVDMAAAEHYMFARLEVSSGSTDYNVMLVEIAGYGALKSLPDALIPRTGDCPPTPSSEEQRAWAYRGAEEGYRSVCDEQCQADRETFNEGLGDAFSNMDF